LRINLKDGSKMVMAMHKLGRISLPESINITDYFARIEEQVQSLLVEHCPPSAGKSGWVPGNGTLLSAPQPPT